MDVTFETSTSSNNGSRRFSIEIGYFDTVLEIKQKAQKYEGIPVAVQRLFFQNQELVDDLNTENYSILQGSQILLVLPDPNKTVRVTASLPSGPNRLVSLDVRLSETVAGLKLQIHRESRIAAPVARFAAYHGRTELQDHKTLAEYGVTDMMDVRILVRRQPRGSVPASAVKEKMMMVVLQMGGGAKKFSLQVDATQKVAELRRELSRLHGHAELQLPAGGDYFFVYKRNAMEEGESFQWHDVKPGDTIEVAAGSIAR